VKSVTRSAKKHDSSSQILSETATAAGGQMTIAEDGRTVIDEASSHPGSLVTLVGMIPLGGNHTVQSDLVPAGENEILPITIPSSNSQPPAGNSPKGVVTSPD